MSDVLLATCARLPVGDEDGDALVSALADLEVTARWAVWSDPDQAWDDALVVLRSTWDYTTRQPEFLAWTRTVARLANAADVVAWSADKTYLRDLDAAGLPVVETVFAAPGDDVVLPATGEFVVKPSVGAGSRGAGRFGAHDHVAALAHAAALHDAGRTVLVQPYLSAVDTAGETALIYLDGRFSHAIRKGAMLRPGAPLALGGPPAREVLCLEETITSREPVADELAVGDAVLAELRRRTGTELLYARVDLLPSERGPVVVELELVEPSLFLEHADGAAGRLAAAIAARA